jgi:hypothetical protein
MGAHCIRTVGILYFTLVHSTPSITLPYYFTSHPPFSINILISFTFTSYVMLYYWCSILLFSFPSFLTFHRVVPLLQTCSTSEFVYDRACFCIYFYLWIYLPHMRENIQFLCFWAWFTSLNMMSSNCIHLPSNYMSLFLRLSNTPLCIYTTFSWLIHQL